VEPLDLRLQRPRGPRVRLAGVVFTARAIDKMRASLPGGDLNGYFENFGFSRVWQHLTGISLRELQTHVAEAASEDDVVAWIDGKLRDANVVRDAINDTMERATTAETPEAWRSVFEETYPPALRERFSSVFDLLEADDDRLYGTTTQA
jgi:hypothetical protein